MVPNITKKALVRTHSLAATTRRRFQLVNAVFDVASKLGVFTPHRSGILPHGPPSCAIGIKPQNKIRCLGIDLRPVCFLDDVFAVNALALGSVTFPALSASRSANLSSASWAKSRSGSSALGKSLNGAFTRPVRYTATISPDSSLSKSTPAASESHSLKPETTASVADVA